MNTAAEKHTCQRKLYHEYSSHSCGNTAHYNEDDKWYCKTHAPSVREERFNAKAALSQKRWLDNRNRLQRQSLEHIVLTDIPSAALATKQSLYLYLLNHSELRGEP